MTRYVPVHTVKCPTSGKSFRVRRSKNNYARSIYQHAGIPSLHSTHWGYDCSIDPATIALAVDQLQIPLRFLWSGDDDGIPLIAAKPFEAVSISILEKKMVPLGAADGGWSYSSDGCPSLGLSYAILWVQVVCLVLSGVFSRIVWVWGGIDAIARPRQVLKTCSSSFAVDDIRVFYPARSRGHYQQIGLVLLHTIVLCRTHTIILLYKMWGPFYRFRGASVVVAKMGCAPSRGHLYIIV